MVRHLLAGWSRRIGSASGIRRTSYSGVWGTDHDESINPEWMREHRGPRAMTREQAHAAGYTDGPYFHATDAAAAVRSEGFFQRAAEDWEVSDYGTIEEFERFDSPQEVWLAKSPADTEGYGSEVLEVWAKPGAVHDGGGLTLAGGFFAPRAEDVVPIVATKQGGWADDPELQKALEDLAEAIVTPVPGRTYEPMLPPSHEMYGGYISEDRSGHLILDGKPLQKLYRVVHPQEWADAQSNGYLQSNSMYSQGYTRASAKPDERWRYQSNDQTEIGTRGITLEIDYDPADQWHASAEGYAATHARIPLSRVRAIS